jgi:para-nitrobenzyl esterase
MKFVYAIAALFTLAACASSSDGAAAQTDVRVESGALRGVIENGVVVHRGIPFAAAPIGELRWRPPAPAAHWDGVRDASAYGPACPQPERGDRAGGGRAAVQSEDCLNLNVWAPEGARNLPVMVWIHGGGHRIGSGTFPLYDGAALARQGVVLVTINYRIGLLGYFAHPALTQEVSADAPLGNYGMMDQIAALEWVQRNIAAFGGDPDQVTIFGESAGAASSLYLIASPRARGLFHRAIVQSGGGLQRPASLRAQEEQGVAAAGRIGLGANATATELRATTSAQWIEALGNLEGLGFGPFIDGRLITEAPSRAFAEDRANDVPLMIGANDNEASVITSLGVPANALNVLGPGLATLRTLYGDISEEEFQRQALGDAFFVAPAAWVAAQAADGAPSYLYHYTYVPERRRGVAAGATHGSEIPSIFQTWDRLPIPPAFITDEDRAFSAMISTCWVSFARTGAPACAGEAAWPAYSDADQIMLFGAETQVVPQPRRPAINFLLNAVTTERAQ